VSGQTVYVIDANSLIYQVFHAIPEMTSPKGEPVNAVYGFTRDLFNILEAKRPDYLFVAFDLPGKTFRHEIYDRYKFERSAMPEELRPQFPFIRRLLQAMRVPVLDHEKYEADDILASVAHLCGEREDDCFLVTGDKDARQLITDRVKIFNVRKNEIYGTEELLADWGIRPDQAVDFQALVGDKVDSIPGVPLIGPKIARELLNTYGNLDGVLDHAQEVSGKKRRENLLNFRDQALMSRELVRLSADVPLEIDWETSRVAPVTEQPLLELFQELGFRTFAEKVRHNSPSKPVAQNGDYRTIDTPELLAQFVKELSQQKHISVDTETTSLKPRRAKVVGLSFAWNEGHAYYLPVRAPAGENCLGVDALEATRGVLENPEVEKVGQNLKYDWVVLRSAGIEMAGISFDTMVASYLLDAGGRNHNLDELARRYLDHSTVKISELIGKGKSQKSMDEVPVEQISYYAAEDADIPLKLRSILLDKLKQQQLLQLFEELEVPLVEILAEMEYFGIRIDTELLAKLSDLYAHRLDDLRQEIYDLAGTEFNIASPKQLATILFEQLKLPVVKRTKTGPSTDVGVLEELAHKHPLPAKIIEYRQYAKLKNTYIDALPDMVNPETCRVHASFNQVVAATGRLSSSDPNLQNIPVRTQAGRDIRAAFIPGEPGWQLLTADYSQIELRVLAHFSQDEQLCQSFANDEDVHAQVASRVHNVPLAEVTSEMRREAKAVNFGVIYGQSPFGLAKQLGIDQAEAAKFIDSYFAGYPKVELFLAKTLAACGAKGYVKTVLGRRRAISGVRPLPRQKSLATMPSRPSSHQLNMAERTAINTVIQGSAADLIKKAMISVRQRLRSGDWRSRMLLQIHDELLFETPAEEVERLAEMVRHEMSQVMQLTVPLKVDVKSGDNWAACEPL